MNEKVKKGLLITTACGLGLTAAITGGIKLGYWAKDMAQRGAGENPWSQPRNITRPDNSGLITYFTINDMYRRNKGK